MGVPPQVRARKQSEVPSKKKAEISSLTLKILKRPKPDKTNVNELYKSLEEYIEDCIENERIPINETAYAWLGLTGNNVYDWEHGRSYTNDGHYEFIKTLKDILKASRAEASAKGELNPVLNMFWNKCHDGYVETSVVKVEPANPLGNQLTAEEIAGRIPKNIGIEGAEFTEK